MSSSAEHNAFDILRQAANKRWQRFLEHPEVNGGQGSLGALCELPQQRPEWFRVWGASEFVSEQCTRNPGMLLELVESGALDNQGTAENTREYVNKAVGNSPDEDTLHKQLRQCRMREMVRIAWRDLGELSNLGETMVCVSALADAAIAQALAHHDHWLGRRFGSPRDSEGNPAHMVVLGLGKLGGGELNYSSDVDLLFTYSAGGNTYTDSTGQRQLDNHEYFLKLGRKLITALEPVTADGFVFRTDLRLRPNGDSGPLVLSFSAMEHYYQTHGRTWERYALIKARVVAGDSVCGQELLAMLRPFVYRKYLDFGAFDAIREMKQLIEREMKHRQTLDNVKLGWGGIREVEFLVQCHQLIRGGREKSLQTGSLYTAMDALVDLGVVEFGDAERLCASYEFLRNTEHRLQMAADRQTQQLPDSEQEKLRLAGSMGFATWQEFDSELDRRRTYIHDQFSRILAESDGEKDSGEQTLRSLLHSDNDYEALSQLQTMGLRNAESIPGLLRGFQGGRLYQAYSNIERDRIDRLLPMALEAIKSHADASRSLSGFINVIEAIGRRTAYLSLLIENPVALSQLLRLCGASPWISNHIGNNPVVLDELLHPIVDIRNRSRSDLAAELEVRLSQVEEDDEEARMNVLREFHHAQVLRIAAADVSGVLEVEDVHGALTDLGETLLQVVFGDALQFASRKLGEPPGDAGVIAYGKFASRELGYYSDLDLVVCYRDAAGTARASAAEREYFYARAGRRFIHLVTTRTSSGVLYEIDMRLRPSGRSGTLVTSLDGFFDYQRSSAWTWEHQALVRARVVVGSDTFRHAFETQRREILILTRDRVSLKADVASMREKMIAANCQSTEELYDLKLDEGGIVDIEFLVQFWVLANAAEYPELTVPRGNVEILATLGDAGIIAQQDASQLSDCFRVYLARSLELKLQGRPVLAGQDELQDQRRFVSATWSAIFGG